MVFTVILTLWQPFIYPAIGSGTYSSSCLLLLLVSRLLLRCLWGPLPLTLKEWSSLNQGRREYSWKIWGRVRQASYSRTQFQAKGCVIFPSLFQTYSKIKEQNKTNKQRQQQKPYLFLDHDSRDSRTLFYLSFKRPKSKPNLRQTGLKTIPFGPTHEGVTAPIPRPEPGQGPMGCKWRGLKAISFTSPL